MTEAGFVEGLEAHAKQLKPPSPDWRVGAGEGELPGSFEQLVACRETKRVTESTDGLHWPQ